MEPKLDPQTPCGYCGHMLDQHGVDPLYPADDMCDEPGCDCQEFELPADSAAGEP